MVEVNEVESTSALEQDMEHSEATAEAVMLSLSLALCPACTYFYECRKCMTPGLYFIFFVSGWMSVHIIYVEIEI